MQSKIQLLLKTIWPLYSDSEKKSDMRQGPISTRVPQKEILNKGQHVRIYQPKKPIGTQRNIEHVIFGST